MRDKFSKVPVDEDTRILSERELLIGSKTALHQKWSWDGLVAESLIFSEEDVSETSNTDLENLARQSSLVDVDSKITISRNDSGFTFINFNFKKT